MPESTYGHTSRVIQNLSLKFKLRHFAPTQNVKFELMGTPRNRNVGKRNDDFRKSCVSGTLKAFSVKIRARLIILEVGARFITACIRNSSAPFFSGKTVQNERNSKKKRTQRSKNYRFKLQSLFWKDKNTFSLSLIVFQRASGVSHAEKYLTLRYNKNRITRRSSQKEYKSFLPENSSPFSSSRIFPRALGNEIESVRIGYAGISAARK